MIGLVVVAAGALGAAVGSFLNVVIHRVPRGESIVRPPSRCPRCGRQIGSFDNVPVLSWVVLRGRCRNCGSPISVLYPLVEAATAALWVGSVLRFGAGERGALAALAGSCLLALALIDLEHKRLPNVIVLPSVAAAVVWVSVVSLVTGRPSLAATALACGAAAFGLLFVIALVSGGMGFGDVKLAAFIGVVTGRFGWEVTATAVFASFFIGGAVAVVLLAAHRATRKAAIPFGPSLAAGALLALFVGPGPARAWLGL